MRSCTTVLVPSYPSWLSRGWRVTLSFRGALARRARQLRPREPRLSGCQAHKLLPRIRCPDRPCEVQAFLGQLCCPPSSAVGCGPGGAKAPVLGLRGRVLIGLEGGRVLLAGAAGPLVGLEGQAPLLAGLSSKPLLGCRARGAGSRTCRAGGAGVCCGLGHKAGPAMWPCPSGAV